MLFLNEFNFQNSYFPKYMSFIPNKHDVIIMYVKKLFLISEHDFLREIACFNYLEFSYYKDALFKH